MVKSLFLVKIPHGDFDWNAFDLRGETPFADNGGEPDGPSWLQDARAFAPDLLANAKAAGAMVVTGWEADYFPAGTSTPGFGGEWCGYTSSGKAYATDRRVALRIQKHHDLHTRVQQSGYIY